jgi:hypothetical protein
MHSLNVFYFNRCATEFLDLGKNDLHGALPDDLGETFVGLRMYVRDGMKSACIGQILLGISHGSTWKYRLHLDHNRFNGTIPSSYMTVGNGRLEILSLDHNQLTGWVPDDFTNWNKMSE